MSGRSTRLLWLLMLLVAVTAALITTLVRQRGSGERALPDESPEYEKSAGRAALYVEAPETAEVFGQCELRVGLGEALGKAAATLPDTQIHDAYDADRDGRYIRVEATFARAGGTTVTVPGFAMRQRPGGRWRWRVRWSPRRPGKWRARVAAEVRCLAGDETLRAAVDLPGPIAAEAVAGIAGPLVCPGEGENPSYLRRLRPDGSSEALWVFGACRAWVVRSQDPNNDWYPYEWIDRRTELLAPMREGGLNLLNQWMAPWEFLIVHHDRAEHWRSPDGTFRREPVPEGREWSAYQCYDQGRAAAFDALVRLCEGSAAEPTVHLLLSPLPHQCMQLAQHPWGAQESGWSPENDAGKQTLERLNGLSAFRPSMKVWDFFRADPSAPLDDWRSQLFDHQANYFRYLVARWGCSRALGIWVIVDELDAVGDVVGEMSERRGWWAHPECDRWLADIFRLFRGDLRRSDSFAYPGDPYRHPLHAATTSFGGQAGRGGNIDWLGPKDARGEIVRPDLFGFHWYPRWPTGATWPMVWYYTVNGVASYATAPIGKAPRLISEFGAADRYRSDDEPSKLYPTLFHHAAWAAIFSGQAGTPMDWDDGKEFGELRWRKRKGIFGREEYPIDHVAEIKALRRFLTGLLPDGLHPCLEKGPGVTCAATGAARALALHAEGRDAAYGWVFAPGGEAEMTLTGIAPGHYRLTWYDPWTGRPVPDVEARHVSVAAGPVTLNAGPVLAVLRERSRTFPTETRLDKGKDAAFKLEPAPARAD